VVHISLSPPLLTDWGHHRDTLECTNAPGFENVKPPFLFRLPFLSPGPRPPLLARFMIELTGLKINRTPVPRVPKNFSPPLFSPWTLASESDPPNRTVPNDQQQLPFAPPRTQTQGCPGFHHPAGPQIPFEDDSPTCGAIPSDPA